MNSVAGHARVHVCGVNTEGELQRSGGKGPIGKRAVISVLDQAWGTCCEKTDRGAPSGKSAAADTSTQAWATTTKAAEIRNMASSVAVVVTDQERYEHLVTD